MTSNMINYRSYVEQVRHNREMERLTGEQQAEVGRHNLAVEAETTRSNLANERIKDRTNVINATHYGKQDFETARHDAIVEYYAYELPEGYGANRAGVDKTKAEIGYITQQTSTSQSQNELNKARTNESVSNVAKNLSTMEQSSAQKAYINAQTALVKAQTAVLPATTRSQVTKDVTQSVKNVLGSAADIINAVTSLTKVAR